MIIHLHQHIMCMTIVIIIAQAAQMIVHHLQIRADAMGAVAVTKKPFHIKGLSAV
jgi:hypothetical protein